MRCHHCKTKLKVTHSYAAGDTGKTQSAICPKCETRYTVVSILEVAERGKGAYALAQKIKNSPPES